MSLRRITSLTMLLSFVVLTLTSIILYIEPEGRVAYWSNWHLMGFTKQQWGDLHTNLGFLFLAAGLLHLFLNWKPMVAYMKNKARQIKVFTPSFNIALIITVVFTLGTLMQVPPFSSILEFGASFKDAASEKYGEPPYGHAELSSLSMFSKRMGYDLEQVEEKLSQSGITYSDASQTLLEIGQANKLTPKEIFDRMKPEEPKMAPGETLAFPEVPFPGLGRKVLGELCSEYGLDGNKVLAAFSEKGINASLEQSLKEIATANDSDPHALFEVIHQVAYPKQ